MFDENFDPDLMQAALAELNAKVYYVHKLQEPSDYDDDGDLLNEEGYIETENFDFHQAQTNIRSGDGADIDMTYKAVHKGTSKYVYLKYHGEYSSWDVNYWNNTPKVVYPKQVTTTQYLTLSAFEEER